MKTKTLQVSLLTALILLFSMSVCNAAARIVTASGNRSNTAQHGSNTTLISHFSLLINLS